MPFHVYSSQLDSSVNDDVSSSSVNDTVTTESQPNSVTPGYVYRPVSDSSKSFHVKAAQLERASSSPLHDS